jgi:hypothetical protein
VVLPGFSGWALLDFTGPALWFETHGFAALVIMKISDFIPCVTASPLSLAVMAGATASPFSEAMHREGWNY